MPFGLACVPATFERLMERVIAELQWKKGLKYLWTEAYQTAFKALKGKLTKAPILAHPELSRPFILDTDRPCSQCGYSSDWKAQEFVQTVSSKPDECDRDTEYGTEITLKHLQGNDNNLKIKDVEYLSSVMITRRQSHLGIKKTPSRFKDRFYWPGVRQDIVSYTADCEISAKRKGQNKRQRLLYGCRNQLPNGKDLLWIYWENYSKLKRTTVYPCH
ncbi:unnamed protein product [Mytilus edulis]|uniref:Integrase zinc-binding domain-containing protein n=1 Tax=Mytilus edulis TaxID=6550 RepID=A0A8S3S0M3_MYTED|nr:unnamed protein product [Mytilus edulis]